MREIDFTNQFVAEPLSIGTKTTLGREFPLARAWYKINLRINISLVVGTGTTPLAEGELLFIKNIFIKTDKNEILVNLPGRALYRIAHFKNGKAPLKDAIAAATAEYSVNIPIYFQDEMLSRPNDSILDTGRYKKIDLEVQLGTVADLLGTVGTSVVTATLDMEIMHSAGIIPSKAQPLIYNSLFSNGPVDASVQQFIDLDRARDLTIKRLYIFSAGSGTGGVSFSGTGDDTIISTLDLLDQDKFFHKGRTWQQLIQDTLEEQLTDGSVPAGFTVIDFVRDKSLFSSLYTGNKSQLKLQWINASAASNDIISVAVEGGRGLVK